MGMQTQLDGLTHRHHAQQQPPEEPAAVLEQRPGVIDSPTSSTSLSHGIAFHHTRYHTIWERHCHITKHDNTQHTVRESLYQRAVFDTGTCLELPEVLDAFLARPHVGYPRPDLHHVLRHLLGGVRQAGPGGYCSPRHRMPLNSRNKD